MALNLSHTEGGAKQHLTVHNQGGTITGSICLSDIKFYTGSGLQLWSHRVSVWSEKKDKFEGALTLGNLEYLSISKLILGMQLGIV